MVQTQVVFEDGMSAKEFRQQVNLLLADNPEADPSEGPALLSLSVREPARFRMSAKSAVGQLKASAIAKGVARVEELLALTESELGEVLAEYGAAGNELLVAYWPEDGHLVHEVIRLKG